VSGPRLRFAPSPTGSLHLGNARTALFNWLVARAQGGTFILRIEDTDTEREQEGSELAILDDLRWLGLTWDEGPEIDGPYGPYRQSQRVPLYADAVGALLASGAAFRCFCVAPGEDAAREAAHHAAGSAAGHRDLCRAIDIDESAALAKDGKPFAVRFRVPFHDAVGDSNIRFRDRLHGNVAVPLAQIPDAVLTRSDRRPTYNFAVVVDDAAMKIDLALRGDDHLSNTPIQVLLYKALGAAVPEFAHVPMVLGPDGERLSKRHGATSVAAWRARGVPPEALINALALMGWAPSGDRTIVSIDEIVREFDLDRVGRSAAIFDPVKLDWISAQHIHAIAPDRLRDEVARSLIASGRLDARGAAESEDWIARVAEFLRPALTRFDQISAGVEPLFHPGGALDDDAWAVLRGAEARVVLGALADWLVRATPSETSDWGALKGAVAAGSGAKGKALFQPIRVALTGREHGRELDRLIPLIVEGQRRRPAEIPSITSRVARTLESRP